MGVIIFLFWLAVALAVAAALAVQRPGAAAGIPTADEVADFLGKESP